MIGDRFSHFDVVGKLGQGGMGEVYRATDSRLGRDVAIKILPAALTSDPERLARLQREARILASLTHPNIAGLHDIGENDGVHFLVMELAEGETLEALLKRGRIERDDALRIAVQIARALEAAHERGIVHRDLKPANVMVDAQGSVKLLDFGLAKAIEGDADDSASAESLQHSPTLTARGTAAGMILGTAAYMSPEQARGKPLDKRTDVWSLGLIVIEMLTGQRVFEGETISDILAAVLRADIEWDTLPADTPPSLRNALRRAVERDADRRLHDVADMRIVLEEILEGREDVALPEAEPAPAAHASRRSVGAVAIGAFATGLLIALAAAQFLPGETATSSGPPEMSFRQLTLQSGGETGAHIAPDGESFVFEKAVDGQRDVFVQRIDGRNPQNLTASCDQDDYNASFSPDGQRIAFRSECDGGGIFVMGATGESRRKVIDEGYGPAWSPDGTKLVVADESPNVPWARSDRNPVWIVDVASGERSTITEHDGVEPAWAPNGRGIAFWGLPPSRSQRDIYIVAADGSTPGMDDAVNITNDPALDWSPAWSGDGRWLYFSSSRGGTLNLWRVPIDPDTGRRTGKAQQITAPTSFAGRVSMSADGTRLTYVDVNIRQKHRFAALDERGMFRGDPVEIPLGSLETTGALRPSPDGTRALFATSGLPQHLMTIDVDGTNLLRLTDGPHRDRQGSWSPDGEWIAFQTDRYDDSCLGLLRADGSGLRPLGGPPFSCWYPRWSPDGQTIAVTSGEGPHLIDPWADDPASTLRPLPQPADDLNFWVLDYSSDGKKLAGMVFRKATVESVAVLDLPTGRYETIADSGFTFTAFVASDTKLITAGDGALALHDLRDGSRTALVEAPGYSFFAARMSDDGRFVSWVETADESDIWLAEIVEGPR